MAVLETPRLVIEPFSERHLTARYVAWLNDPEVVRFSENRHRPHTPESCRAYYLSYAGTPHFFWAILSRDEGHIGNISAHVDAPNLIADLGILIGERRAWGKGYGAEAWRAACDFLLASGMRKVSAGCAATNEAMLAIMRKSGMVEDGRRRRHLVIDGAPVDVVHAALFRE